MWSYAEEDRGFSHSPSLSLETSSSEESRPARVHQHVHRQGRKRNTSVYVGGLHAGIKREDLKKNFKNFGIKKVWVAQKPPGFAFIEFSDDQDAHNAIREMNGAVIKGCKIRVALSNKDQMSGGGGGGGTRYCGGRGFRCGRAPRGGHQRVVGGGGRRPYYGGRIHQRSDSRYDNNRGGGRRPYYGGGGGFHSTRPIGNQFNYHDK